MATADERRERLTALQRRAGGCERCPALVATRAQVVFGAGSADADVLFVGEAPSREEDARGTPFAGRAGELLARLLGEVGLAREDVYVTSVVKCRPPDNRSPVPAEIANCRAYLEEQLDLVRPTVVCTLGNFATRLVRDAPEPITRVRGRAELATIGGRRVRLLPLLHPSAALYTPANVALLRADVALIPGLVAEGEPEQPAPQTPPARASVAPAGRFDGEAPMDGPAEPDQLGLF